MRLSIRIVVSDLTLDALPDIMHWIMEFEHFIFVSDSQEMILKPS